MFEKINIHKLFAPVEKWFTEYFWTPGTLYQLAIVFVAFIVAKLLHRLIKRRLFDRIQNSALPPTLKKIAKDMVRLLYPIMALILVFVTTLIAAKSFAMDASFNVGVMKVLMAWIAIRIAVEFIGNVFIRNIFAVVIWSIAVLSIFGILDETTQTLDAFSFTIGNFRLSALVVIKGLLLIFTLLYFAIFISGFAERRVMSVQGLSRSSQVLIAKTIRITLVVFALLLGITSAGIDLSLFAVFGGAIGLGVGFGLQKGISNLFSGMLLLMDQSIKPGDVIELENSGTYGWVNRMAARYTEIVTRDNKSYLIPNEDFITQRVINWSHGNNLIRIPLTFGVHYDSDLEKVIEIAIAAAKTPKRVMETPEPVCWITEFGDSSVNFSLRFWIKDAEAGLTNVKGEVYMALWKAFKENKITIPYPQRDLHIVSGSLKK